MGWIFKSSHANIHICICTHILLKDKDKSRSLYRAKTSREFQLGREKKTTNNQVLHLLFWSAKWLFGGRLMLLAYPALQFENQPQLLQTIVLQIKKGWILVNFIYPSIDPSTPLIPEKKTYVLVHLWKYVDNLGNNQFCLSIIPPWKEKIHSVAQCSSAWINAFSRSEIHVWHSIHETPLHPHEKAKEIGL